MSCNVKCWYTIFWNIFIFMIFWNLYIPGTYINLDCSDCDVVGDMKKMGSRTCKHVAEEMRRMGEEILALGDDLGDCDGDDGDSSESEYDSEWEGLEEVGVKVYRVQRLGGRNVKVGEREITMREMLGRSCGCFDIGDENFRLLTSKSISKFA